MKTLLPAWQEFTQCGGIRGKRVTMEEREMKVYKKSL
jgi:hypothetical protein